jgi:arginine decarboxylase
VRGAALRQFKADALVTKLRSDVEAAVRNGLLDYEVGQLLKFYEDGLNGYTSLEDRRGRWPREGRL